MSVGRARALQRTHYALALTSFQFRSKQTLPSPDRPPKLKGPSPTTVQTLPFTHADPFRDLFMHQCAAFSMHILVLLSRVKGVSHYKVIH